MEVAIFDLDKEILKRNSLFIGARFANSNFKFILKSIIFLPNYIAFLFNLINHQIFLEKYLISFGICEFFNYASESKKEIFFRNLLANLTIYAKEKIKNHKKNNHQIILITCYPRIIFQQLADYLEVELISTDLKKRDDKWTPMINGKICLGEEKVKKLKQKFRNFEECKIHFYGCIKNNPEILNSFKFTNINRPNKKNSYFFFFKNKFIPFYIIGLLIYGFYVINNFQINLIYLIYNMRLRVISILFIISFGYFLRYLRWRIMLNSLKLKSPIKIDFFIWLSSFAFTLSPGKSGEALRSVFLKEKCNLPIFKTLPCIFMERFSDGMSVLIIIIVNIYSLKKLNINFLTPIILILISIIILFLSKNIKFLRRYIMRFLSKLFPKKFMLSSYESLNSFDQLFKTKVILTSTYLGIASWLAESLGFWILLRGLNLNQISFGHAAVAHLGAGLLGVFSFLPGGIGATEIGTTAILTVQNVPLKLAITSTILIRIMTLWFSVFIGILALIFTNIKKDNFVDNSYSNN